MIKQIFPLPKIRFGFSLFILFIFLMTGCSKKLDSPYEYGHKPPPEGSEQKATKGSTPATQRPYTIKGKQYTPMASAHGYEEKGLASWYGKKFHGRKTSNGETYDMYAMTAAHKTLPMGTWVKVNNLGNNRQIIVRVNDRGPFVRGRIIDLSYTGAKKMGMVGPGMARVKVTALGRATSYSKKTKAPVAFTPMNYWQGNFTVQVGAFQIKHNAENYKKKLSNTYMNSHITTYEDDRGSFYRVRIGRFTNLKDAVRFSEKLMEDGFEYTFAVAE
jgi:rare lipoprotein A